jgi:hypothetical protein
MAAQRPEHAHATDSPASATLQPRPTHTTTGCLQDRRPVVSKRPLHSLAAAKMSPHIRIGPEPVLAAHARSQTATGSRCQAGGFSPAFGTEFSAWTINKRNLLSSCSSTSLYRDGTCRPVHLFRLESSSNPATQVEGAKSAWHTCSRSSQYTCLQVQSVQLIRKKHVNRSHHTEF